MVGKMERKTNAVVNGAKLTPAQVEVIGNALEVYIQILRGNTPEVALIRRPYKLRVMEAMDLMNEVEEKMATDLSTDF